MLIKLFYNKKGQNVAEYALLLSVVVAGVIAMQTYTQRSLQARMRDASIFMREQSNGIGNTDQYEPYYMSTNYDVERESISNKRMNAKTVAYDSTTNRKRLVGGSEVMTYNNSMTTGGRSGLVNGI